MPFSLLYISCPDEATAQQLATFLLERRYVACANIFPINSHYWWQGELQNDSEKVLLLKTRTDLQPLVEQQLLQLHPYTTPCIMYWQVQANAEYEAWIHAETIPTP